MTIRIRKFRKTDAIQVSRMIKRAFRALILKPYSKQSVEAQIRGNSTKSLIEKANRIKYFVAVEKNRIFGVGGYDSKKVHTFFVEPKLQGKGIGKMIINKVLTEAKKDKLKSLKCWSTFYAEKFYKRYGFKKIKNIRVKFKETPITFVEMTKKL